MSTEEEIDGWRFFRAAMPRSAVRLPPGIGCAPLVSVLVGLNGMTVLGFVGSFYRYEGLDLLIDALKLLLPARRRTKLLLVRGGPDEVELKARTTAHGLQDSVVFTGCVQHGQVQRYYDLIDVLVYPRRAMRLTDLVTQRKPLEGMGQSRVLVPSNVGGHLELIRDRETGFLFRAVDTAHFAFTAGTTGHRCARRSAGLSSASAWAQSVARYTDVYARAVYQLKR